MNACLLCGTDPVSRPLAHTLRLGCKDKTDFYLFDKTKYEWLLAKRQKIETRDSMRRGLYRALEFNKIGEQALEIAL